MSNKHILITGGSRGIGKAIAQRLLKDNYTVSVFARESSALKQLSEESPHISTFACDVANYEQVEDSFNKAIKQNGDAHGLICCAGIHGPLGKFWQTDILEWEAAFRVNVFGSMYAIRAAHSSMKQNKNGHIVLFSGGGQASMPGFSAYVGSKGSIWRLTETLAAELREDNIMINAVAPGAVDTGLQDQVIKEGPEKVTQEYYNQILKLKKDGGTSPDYAANLCAFLMSKESLGLTGKTLSAKWDKPQEIVDKKTVSDSDLFTYKRVINSNGGTRF